MLFISKNSSRLASAIQMAMFFIAGGIVSVSMGQDAGWDLVNYHIYNVWHLLNNRYGLDIFAAGIQGYFSPYLDVIYYALGFKWLRDYPHLVSFLEGFPYGFMLWISWKTINLISLEFEFTGQMERLALNIVALILSATGVFVWSQVGTVSNEITTSALILYGLYYYLRKTYQYKNESNNDTTLILSGMIFGFAAGLKLTATIYAPGLGVVILFQAEGPWEKIKSGFLFSLGWFITFAILYGPWAWHLYNTTGNPFYPMFNGIFHSPLAAPHGGRDIRFLPNDIWQWIFFPFYWLNDNTPIANTLAFRDARYATAYIFIVLYALSRIFNNYFSNPKKHTNSGKKLFDTTVIFTVVSYLCWLVVFSTMRYTIVIEVFASIFIIFLSYYTIRPAFNTRYSLFTFIPIVLIAYSLISTVSIPDWGHIEFGRKTFSAKVPKLPHNSLVILARQPMGLLAPLINEKNPSTNYIGLPSCFADNGYCANGFFNYGTGTMMKKLLHDHLGPIFVANYTNRNPSLPQLSLLNLRQSSDGCFIMSSNMTPDVSLCPASYQPDDTQFRARITNYHLIADVKNIQGHADVRVTWLDNPCESISHQAEMRLNWSIPNKTGQVELFVQAPPKNKERLFARSGITSEATTGKWVSAGQKYIFKDMEGHKLVVVTIHYVPCAE